MKKLFSLLVFGFVLISVKAQDDPLKEYVGTYKFPDGSTIPSIDVKIEGGILVASSSAGSSPLEKLAKDTFSIVNYNGMMYFLRDANKVVVGMKFEVQDLVQEGKKEGAGLTRQWSVGQWSLNQLPVAILRMRSTQFSQQPFHQTIIRSDRQYNQENRSNNNFPI